MPRYQAIGALVALWEVGQAHWKKNKSLIPQEVFNLLPKNKDLLDCGFLTHKADGYYCKGAEERWGFLLVQSENGKKGGLSSAEARLKKYGTAIPFNAFNLPDVKNSRSETEANTEANRSEPNHSSSSSSSFLKKEEKKKETTLAQNKFERKFDFDLIYSKYPRKIGKQKGLVRLKASIKTPEDFDLLKLAVDHYCKYCLSQNTEPKYIKHFSTFIGEWRDWVEPVIEKKPGDIDWSKVFEKEKRL